MGDLTYSAILFDASFCLKKFPDGIFDRFSYHATCYASNSLHSLYEEFCDILAGDEKRLADAYDDYSDLKDRVIFRDTVDTWHLLGQLVENYRGDEGQILVVTADGSLIRKIILTNLQVDIFHLVEDRVIPYLQFPEMKGNFDFPNYDDGREGGIRFDGYDYPTEITLYLESGDEIPFTFNEDLRGSEAGIYFSSQCPEMIAKVFPEGRLSKEKQENILQLYKYNAYKASYFDWFLLPKELLYWDPEHRNLAGFLQEYIHPTLPMEHEIYFGSTDDDTFTPRDTMDRCIRLTRQVALLNYLGISISDYNLTNFALPDDGSNYIYMWDTDSFCTPAFRPWMTDRNSKLPGEFNINDPLDAFRMCTEHLYLCVFRMLSIGREIVNYNDTKKLIMLPSADEPWEYIRYVPPLVLKLLVGVYYQRNIEPSVEALLHALHVYREREYVGQIAYDLPYTTTMQTLAPWDKKEILEYIRELKSADEIYQESDNRYEFWDNQIKDEPTQKSAVFLLPKLATVRTPRPLISYPEPVCLEGELVTVDPSSIESREHIRNKLKRWRSNARKENNCPKQWPMYIMLACTVVSLLILVWMMLSWGPF